MNDIIQQTLKSLDTIPLEYKSFAFPLLLEHLLLIDRQKQRNANPYPYKKVA